MNATPLVIIIPLITIIVLLAGGCLNSNPQEEITVSAAISLSNALKEIGAAFEKENPGVKINFNFGASGTLKQQIEQGAPVDVFASASQSYMDELEEKGLILNRTNFAANSLVLISPSNITLKHLNNTFVEKIAIGNPKTVPAGAYAKSVLVNLGIWNELQPKLVYGENVRQVLEYTERGEVDAGIVYLSDTTTATRKLFISSIPENLHPPIVYPIAIARDSRHIPTSQKLIDFIESEQGKRILKKYGFEAL